MAPVLLVTGGSRGIGAACARLGAKHGYDVCVNYQSRGERAADVVADIERTGRKAIAVQADVSREVEVLGLFRTVDQELGTLTALVNNAGILTRMALISEMTEDRLNQLWTVNITSMFLCAREAVKRMSTANGGKGGAIVNLSSAAARLGAPGEFVDYAASKGAIDTFTRGLAREVASQGIRVNGVRPGVIDTEIHELGGGNPDRVEKLGPTAPMGRAGSASEVAEAVLWLLSEQASYVTDSIIDVTGGR